MPSPDFVTYIHYPSASPTTSATATLPRTLIGRRCSRIGWARLFFLLWFFCPVLVVYGVPMKSVIGFGPSSHCLPLNQAHQWSVPPNGMIKINVDAAARKSVHSFGVAVVGRDHFGVVIFAVVHRLPRKFSSHLAREICSTKGHPGSTAAEFETDAISVCSSNQ